MRIIKLALSLLRTQVLLRIYTISTKSLPIFNVSLALMTGLLN